MKIGLYFCNCGSNIAEVIDPEKVCEGLAQDGPAYFKTSPFLCSEEGKAFLEQDLRDERPDRVVVAACTPREHEATFMRVMEQAGMNPYLMQMVNLREQVAWVTEDPERAVRKAVLAIRGALLRVTLQQALEREELEVASSVLVLGAGPAGLKASLTLARAGRKVVLVEKGPALGGLPVLYEELFPDLECGPCMLEPLMGELLHGEYADNIELLTLSELEGVKGFFGNFTATIRRRPRYLDEAACIGCGECVEACPASGGNPIDCGMGEKKAMAFAFPGALPNLPYLDPALCTRFTQGDECRLCGEACPMGEDVVRYQDAETLVERQVGAIVMATGASLYDCTRFPQLGYGVLPQVKTAHELERMLASNGPFSGDPAGLPENVLFIHCVGSLDDGHRPYCSGVCCQYAFKLNHLLRSRLPQVRIHHLYREIAAAGKEASALYLSARNGPDTALSRYGSLAGVSVREEEGGLRVCVSGGESLSTDLVVLCPAVVPGEDAGALGELLEVSLDRFGFFEEMHGRIDASSSKMRGIYLAGACQGPADIQRAALQGVAAAGSVLCELVEGRKLRLEPLFASVDPELCSGCRVCLRVCPYRAVSFDGEKQAACVSSVLCHGCGTCVAACPSGASRAQHFTGEMILAEIEGALQ